MTLKATLLWKIGYGILFGVAFVLWSTASYFLEKSPPWAGLTIVLAAMVMVGVIIASPIDRLLKGFGLLIIAISTTVIFKGFVEPKLSAVDGWLVVLKAQLDLLSFVCAGAGGSLIAVEGDRNATEKPLRSWQVPTKPPALAQQALIDYTPSIQSLGQKLEDQTLLIAQMDEALRAVTEQQRRSGRQLWVLGLGALAVALVLGALAVLGLN